MRLLLYYISHTFMNSIKKIFRTWVAIFILLMVAIGILAGVGAVVFTDYVGGNEEQIEETVESEEALDEEGEDEKPLREVFAELSGEEKVFVCRIIADVVFLISLFSVLFSVYGARKGGTEIFTMADVNFLFTAPIKPQSVLLFKTILQMGLLLAGSAYFVFQIPNLVLNIGLAWWHIALVFLLILVIPITCKLASILVYTVTATNTALRKYIPTLVYGIGLLLVAVVAFSMRTFYDDFFTAVYEIFSNRYAMAIPFVGWITGVIYSLLMGEYLAAGIYGGLLFVGFGAFIYLIWKIKADFYEDALTNANTLQEKMEAARTGKKAKSEHAKRLKRDGEIGRGSGADTFFYKHMHHRKRIAYMGVVTNSMLFYAGFMLLFGFLNQRMLHGEMPSWLPGVCLLAVVFCKSYASPMMEECRQNFIYLVPESGGKKIAALMLAEMAEIFLDLLPAMVLMMLFFDVSFLKVLLWDLLILSFAFILTAVSLFIDMIIPDSLPEEIKAIFMIFGKFAGVLPMGIVMLVLAAMDLLSVAFGIALICHVLVGTILTAISASLLHIGN